MKRHPRHITLKKSWPERYFGGLTRPLMFTRERELMKRKKNKKKFILRKSNRFARPRKSRWTLQFHKVYPGLKFNKSLISKKTGIPVKTLDTVYDRGRRAWQTGGSRPGMTADQWGVARLYKYVLVTKKKAPRAWYATKFDPDQDLRRPTRALGPSGRTRHLSG
jgi:hypothetical protein